MGCRSLALGLSLLLLASACTYESDVGLLPTSGAALQVIGSDPTFGERGVPINAVIELTFPVPLLAEDIAETDLRLYSGLIETTGRQRIDYLDRSISLAPSAPLRPDLRYRVYVRGSLRGLDGSRLEESVIFEFTTGETTSSIPDPRPVPTSAEIQSIWNRRCSSCHRGSEAAAGVDLSSIESTLRTMRDVKSVGSELSRVRSGDNARSYLPRKLDGQFATGLPMPPGTPLTAAEQRQVSDWIDHLGPANN